MDPYEDPAAGLERISVNQHLRRRDRRIRIEDSGDSINRVSEKAEHALSGKYESLDYEIVENDIYRAEEATKDFHVTTSSNISKHQF